MARLPATIDPRSPPPLDSQPGAVVPAAAVSQMSMFRWAARGYGLLEDIYATGQGVRTATTSEHNKRLVRRALEEIYANGNPELADELVHPDFVDHEPAHPDHPPGPESVKQTVRSLHDAFGGLRFEVQDEIAEGDKVVQRVIMSGRHTGSLMGHEPTGKEFAVRHIYIWRIAGGKMVEHWGSRDDLGLLGQLGFLQMHAEPEAG
jgi:predicted ester cyclase